jgi:glycosyltransferase involved in cell wall biosynthesis
MSKKLKIAMIAPPWLSLYPGCYYGIENVLHHLAKNLTEAGHHVDLFTVSGTTTKVTHKHWYHKEDQYQHIHRPWYQVVSISISHILYALNTIREAGDFDIIHDHNSFMGPALMAQANYGLPPILHTLHEPFTDSRTLKKGIPDNRLMYEQFKSIKHLYFNGVSRSQISHAPRELKKRIRGVVYNGVDLDEYIYSAKKDDYFTLVASTSPNKGQGIAAKACYELGAKLKMAGTVGGKISTKQQLATELANPASPFLIDANFRYFKEDVAPYLKEGQIEHIGTVTGEAKKKVYAKAKAFLFPIDWEEPFGISVIDALASGTPVICYRRGALPEIIRHGVNGFIANNYEELKYYMQRADQIDPEQCRRSVERKFSTEILTKNYLNLYKDIITDHKRVVRRLVNLNLPAKNPLRPVYGNLQNLIPPMSNHSSYIRQHK